MSITKTLRIKRRKWKFYKKSPTVLHLIWMLSNFFKFLSSPVFDRDFFLHLKLSFFHIAQKDQESRKFWERNGEKKNSMKNLRWFYILSECSWIFSNFYSNRFWLKFYFQIENFWFFFLIVKKGWVRRCQLPRHGN